MSVLLGKNFGWRHQGTLKTGFHHGQAGDRRNDGFSATHIPLQQADHRITAIKVLQQYLDHTLLGAGQLEWQTGCQFSNQATVCFNRRATQYPDFRPPLE